MNEIVQVAALGVVLGLAIGALVGAILAAIDLQARRADRKHRARRRRITLRRLGDDLVRNPSMRRLYWCDKCRTVMWGKGGHTDDDGWLCFGPTTPLEDIRNGEAHR